MVRLSFRRANPQLDEPIVVVGGHPHVDGAALANGKHTHRLDGGADRDERAPGTDIEHRLLARVVLADTHDRCRPAQGPRLHVPRGWGERGGGGEASTEVCFRARVGATHDRFVNRSGLLRWREAVQHVVEVNANPPRTELRSEHEATHRGRDCGAAQDHVTAQLGPCAHGPFYLDQTGRHPRRDSSSINDRHHIRNLLLGRQSPYRVRREVPHKTVQHRPIRVEIEPLHIQQTEIRGLHQHWHPSSARLVAHRQLHVQAVAFLDEDIDPVEQHVERLAHRAAQQDANREIGVDLGDPPRRGYRFVHAQIEQRRWDAIEVRQLDLVEICQRDSPTQPLQDQRVRDHMTDTQAHDRHTHPAEPLLLGQGDLVSVPIQAQQIEVRRGQHANRSSTPRVTDPTKGWLTHLLTHRRISLAPTGKLICAPIEQIDIPCRSGHQQLRQPVRIPHIVDNDRPVGVAIHEPAGNISHVATVGHPQHDRCHSAATDGGRRRQLA